MVCLFMRLVDVGFGFVVGCVCGTSCLLGYLFVDLELFICVLENLLVYCFWFVLGCCCGWVLFVIVVLAVGCCVTWVVCLVIVSDYLYFVLLFVLDCLVGVVGC